MNRINNRYSRHLLNFVLVLLALSHTYTVPVLAGHGLAPALVLTTIKSTDGDSYALYSPALNYTADFEIRNLHFIFSATPLFPLWATQNGNRYTNSDYYDIYMGTDLFFGIARDFYIKARYRLSPAVGWHQNGMFMRGKSRYLNFYSLTSGIGLHALMIDLKESRLLNYLTISAGLDFVDYLYQDNKLRVGFTLCLGVGHRF